MWQMIPAYWQVAIIAGAGVLGWEATQAVAILIGGNPPGVLRCASLVATVLLVIGVPIADHLWPRLLRRLPWLETLTFPNLNGCWRGTLQSNWKDPATNIQIGPRDVVVEIRQNLLSVSVALGTSESRSLSTWCRLEPNHAARIFRLRHLYENEPQAGVAHQSSKHEGMCWLEFRPDDPGKLTGQYYTYRGTRGDIELRREPDGELVAGRQSSGAAAALS